MVVDKGVGIVAIKNEKRKMPPNRLLRHVLRRSHQPRSLPALDSCSSPCVVRALLVLIARFLTVGIRN